MKNLSFFIRNISTLLMLSLALPGLPMLREKKIPDRISDSRVSSVAKFDTAIIHSVSGDQALSLARSLTKYTQFFEVYRQYDLQPTDELAPCLLLRKIQESFRSQIILYPYLDPAGIIARIQMDILHPTLTGKEIRLILQELSRLKLIKGISPDTFVTPPIRFRSQTLLAKEIFKHST